MRIARLYQFWDLKANAVAGPIQSHYSDGPAIRAFISVLRNGETSPGMYPEDYQLIIVGEQNEETGQIVGREHPETVLTGKAWKDAQEANK